MSPSFHWRFEGSAELMNRAIGDMLTPHRGNRSRSSMEGAMQDDSESENPTPTVLPSSTELFYFYGQTMEQCSKYTTGEPLKKLGKIFAKWLKVYSGMFPLRPKTGTDV
jgi:hypothetical protein